MIILSINVVVSTLFIKIRDGGETLTYNIWWSIAETKFFSHTVHRILREFHRVALNILLHYPLWRLQYWHFFCDFYDCLFELEGVGVLKKEQCQWWFIWHLCLPFLHTDVQMPVLKNQCILFSCFPSVMRQKIQMSNTSCEEKWTAISSSVSRKIMNTNFSRPQSSVRVQERHCIQQGT